MQFHETFRTSPWYLFKDPREANSEKYQDENILSLMVSPFPSTPPTLIDKQDSCRYLELWAFLLFVQLSDFNYISHV